MALESTTQPTLRDRALRLLEKGQHGDKASHYCDYFLSVLIVVNVLCICIESVPELAVEIDQLLLDKMFIPVLDQPFIQKEAEKAEQSIKETDEETPPMHSHGNHGRGGGASPKAATPVNKREGEDQNF